MIVYGTRVNSLCERLLRECDLTLSKAISTGHAAEETRKHAAKFSDLNLPPTLIRFLKGNSIRLVITLTIRTQETS